MIKKAKIKANPKIRVIRIIAPIERRRDCKAFGSGVGTGIGPVCAGLCASVCDGSVKVSDLW